MDTRVLQSYQKGLVVYFDEKGSDMSRKVSNEVNFNFYGDLS